MLYLAIIIGLALAFWAGFEFGLRSALNVVMKGFESGEFKVVNNKQLKTKGE